MNIIKKLKLLYQEWQINRLNRDIEKLCHKIVNKQKSAKKRADSLH